MRFMAVVLFAAFMLVISKPAVSQENMCGPYEAVERSLGIAQEQVVWRGVIGADMMVEVWGNIENPQAWTLVSRHSSGMACAETMGEDWEILPIGQQN